MKMYEPQRLHPFGIFVLGAGKIYALGQAFLPLLVVAIGTKGSHGWLLPLIPLVLAVFAVYVVLYWTRYVFYVSDRELRLEYGVLVRKRRYIPFERIQTVQISAGILQRLFGLVKVQVETAGGGDKAEVVLAALSRPKAEELRQILRAEGKPAENITEAKPAAEYRLSVRSLLLLASTSNGIGVALSALLVVVSQLDDIFPNLHIWEQIGTYMGSLAAAQASVILVMVFSLLLLAWLLSLLGTVIRFAGFRVVREGDHIRITRGLLEKQQLTIPIKRIQAITLVESVLRQPLGLVSVQIVSISNLDAKNEGNVLFPVVPKARLHHFLDKMVPEFSMSMQAQKLPGRSRPPYILLNAIPAAMIAAIGALVIPHPWGYLAFIIVLLAAWLGNAQFKDAGWQVEDDRLFISSRILGRISYIIPRRRIQSLEVSRHYFQKRRRVNSLQVALASSNAATGVKLKGMDENKSAGVWDWFATGANHRNPGS